MFVLGILSLIQILFLPGFLVLLRLNMCDGITRTLFFSFGLSLIINHFLVIFLVLLHLYISPVMLMIFAVEIFFLIKWLKEAKSENQNLFHNSSLNHYSKYSVLDAIQNLGIWKIIIIFVAIVSLYPFVQFLIHNPLDIFRNRDAGLNWNRWAFDWFNGVFPHKTWNYPQLLPSNWSITYKFMGSSIVQGFAKTLAPIFLLGIFFLEMDLAVRLRKIAYIIAVPVAGFLLMRFNGVQGAFNYADVPCVFFGVLSLYCLLTEYDELKNFAVVQRKKIIILGAVFAAGAALTKQAGLYTAIIYPFLFWVLFLKNKDENLLKNEHLFWKIIFLLLVLIFPWYLYKYFQIFNGLDFGISRTLSGCMETGYLRQLFYIHNILAGKAGLGAHYFYILFAIVFFLSVAIFYDALWRKIVLLFVPFVFIWVFKYSYDFRNLALFTVIVSICVGFGIEYFFKKARRLYISCKSSEKKSLLFLVILSIVFVIFYIINMELPAQKLLNRQKVLEIKTIGGYNLNKWIYGFFAKNGYDKMLTNELEFGYLPLIKKYSIYDNFANKSILNKVINSSKPKYIFINELLLAQYLAPKYGYNMEHVTKETYESTFRKKFKINDYVKKNILDKIKSYKVILSKDYILFIQVKSKNFT